MKTLFARYENVVDSVVTINGETGLRQVVPGATVTVFESPAATFAAGVKVPLSPDSTGVGASTSNNPVTADDKGNFGFWVAPGTYDYWVSSDGVDNGPFTITLGVSSDGQFNVMNYGAKGDDITDDAAAIQAAIDDAEAAGGGRIFVPAGTYRVETTLSIPTGVALEGTGIYSELKFYGVGGIQIPQDSNTVSIHDLTISSFAANGTANPKTYIGIESKGVSGNPVVYPEIYNIHTNGWQTDVKLSYTWGAKIDHLISYNGKNGILLFGASVNNSIMNCEIISSDVAGAAVSGVKDGANRGEGLVIANNLFYGAGYSLYFPGGDAFLSLNVCNNILDQAQVNSIYVQGVTALMVSNNWIWAAGDAIYSDNVGAASDLESIVSGNVIYSNAGRGVFIGGNNKGWRIIGNTINVVATKTGVYNEIGSTLNSVIGNNFPTTGAHGLVVAEVLGASYSGNSGAGWDVTYVSGGTAAPVKVSGLDADSLGITNAGPISGATTIEASNGVTVSTGSNQILAFFKTTVLGIDLASVAAGAISAIQTTTVTGARVGDIAFVTGAAAMEDGCELIANVTNNDEVKWYLKNNSGVAVDRPSQNYTIRVLR